MTLLLYFNKIHTIHPQSFRDNTILVTLQLHYNLLGSVPEVISGLQNLQQLTLSGNQIRTINSGFFKENTLMYSLILGNNLIEILPELMFDDENHVNINELRINNNPLSCNKSLCWLKYADWITIKVYENNVQIYEGQSSYKIIGQNQLLQVAMGQFVIVASCSQRAIMDFPRNQPTRCTTTKSSIFSKLKLLNRPIVKDRPIAWNLH